VSRMMERVRMPDTFPKERVLLGELHLIRSRLDETLGELADLVARGEQHAGWSPVEEAARLARRALAAAVSVAPPLPSHLPRAGQLRVGELRVDALAQRQWYGQTEFELTPLHHRLLATMAADPYRVFGKDELLRDVWGRRAVERTNAVNTSVSRLRRTLVRAAAPPGVFLLSLHGVGWALTRPD
jgi:DNA-binding response OmpR family regulator